MSHSGLGLQDSSAHAVPVGSRGRQRLAENAAWCQSCVVADGVVHQVGPSGTACASGSSKLVKAHIPRRGRPSCRNTPQGRLVGAAPLSHSTSGPPPLWTRRISYGEVLAISWGILLHVGGSMIQPTWEWRSTASEGEWSSETFH